MDRKLSERKMKILKALVDCYIDTAEPVSSSVIRDKYVKEFSSATIRNELAALEELGYIEQPHTSAGRVPLPPAYKLYASDLFPERGLTAAEVNVIEESFERRFSEVEEITKRTAKLISDITNYTSFVVVNKYDDVMIKEVKLVEIGDSALVLVVTDSGVLKDKTIDLPEGVRGEQVQTAGRAINNMFSGKTLGRISKNMDDLEDRIAYELQDYRDLFEKVLNLIKSYAETGDKVFVEGALKMLDYPEYQKVEDAKNFLEVVSDKEKVASLALWKDDIEFSIKIGQEDGLNKSAMVTVKYKVNGKDYGQAGVIGPERMDYKKVISVLEYLGHMNNPETAEDVLDSKAETDED